MNGLYVIGGAPCAGKTTIAHIIAQEHGWRIYHVDRHVESFLQRADRQQQPALTAYRQMGAARFLAQEPAAQLAQIQAMSAEQFPFIVDDLAAMDDGTPILIEGAHLRPVDVMTVLDDAARAFWLVPAEDFLLEIYPRRGQWVLDLLRAQFERHQQVDIFDGWMTRDLLFAGWAATAAHAKDIQVLTVDGSTTLLENAAIVMQHFGLSVSPQA